MGVSLSEKLSIASFLGGGNAGGYSVSLGAGRGTLSLIEATAAAGSAYGRVMVTVGDGTIECNSFLPVKKGDTVTVLSSSSSAVVIGCSGWGDALNLEMQSITAKVAHIDEAWIGKLEAEEITVDKLIATDAFVESLNANNITADTIVAQVADLKTLKSDYAEIKRLQAESATIEYLEANYATIGTLEATYATIDFLKANYADVDTLKAAYATIDYLKANYLTAESADIKYANIDFTNVGVAQIGNLYAKSGIIKDVVSENGKITGELVGVTIKGDLIEGNTILADKLVIRGEDGLFYKLNTDGATVESEQTTANALDGSHIIAKSITASKVSVTDLVAFGATIAGFNISDTSINTASKTSVDNTTRGIFVGSNGTLNIGDANNYIKFKDGVLDIQANSIKIGSKSVASTEDVADVNANINALTTRVINAETSIESNNDAILLRATKTEVATAKSEAVSTAASDATTKANNALAAAKTYADAQIKVSADSITSTVSSTYATKSTLENEYTKKTLPDTRNTNQNPQWYMKNYPRQIITEFKGCTTIGLSGETYCSLQTFVPWGNSSGGYPKQTAKVGDKEYWRVGISGTAWSAWQDVVNRIASAESSITQLSNKITANVTETTSLGTRMSTVEQTASSLSVALKSCSKSYGYDARSGQACWVKLGTLYSAWDNSNFKIVVLAGNGYNGSASQNSQLEIVIKDGWQSTQSATSAFGVSVTRQNCEGATVNVRATSHNVCDVWVYLPWPYSSGTYTISGEYTDWVHVNVAQTAAPTSGTAQDVAYRMNSENAAKTATNYMEYTSEGLAIGNKSSGSWSGTRTLATSADYRVLNSAGTALAKYGASTIDLGCNSSSSVVKLAGGNGQMSYGTGTGRNQSMLTSSGTNGSRLWWAGTGTNTPKAYVEAGYGTSNSQQYGLVSMGVSNSSASNFAALSVYGAQYNSATGTTVLTQPYVLASPTLRTPYGTVYAGTVLYNGASHGTITLSGSAANYTMLEIYYYTNSSRRHCAKVYSPNGKSVDLFGMTGDGEALYIKFRTVYINGASIATTGKTGEAWIGASIQGQIVGIDRVAICTVIGYK